MNTRKFLFLILLPLGFLLCIMACQKWKDPAPVTDPRLTNPYCNDPNAVNYNWGFPGKPDSLICFYPSDLFRGKYIFNDSIFLADNTYVASRIDTFFIYALSESKLALVGLCANGDSLRLTGLPSYIATVDSTGLTGQTYCSIADTVSGTITKDQVDTTILLVNLTVVSDTGTNLHIGNATRIK